MHTIKIPLHEIDVATARSRGPGGQNVNKTESKVVLRFPVAKSKTLNESQKSIVLEKLANRINKMGELIVSAESERAQHRNYLEAMEKLQDMIREALIPEKERYATKIPKQEKVKRLVEKKVRSHIKKGRSGIQSADLY
ncbi:MAG: alternative ribosome rescue aminoacyl-tRNA hydrolase ArfB [Patescibacteria group bacterium]